MAVGLLLCLFASAQGEVKVDSVMDKAMSDTIHRADKPVLTAKDTLALLQLQKESKKIKRDWTTWKPNPKRAMWLAIVLPGAGQIYNRKYWKLPIVYGGFLGCAYALTWNNQMLHDYSQAYLDIMDSDPNTKSYEKMLPMGYDITGKEARFQEMFKNKKNYFRKYRDMSIFAFAGVYLLSVVDAYVDGELSTFDISEDLTLHVAPSVFRTPHANPLFNQNAFGFQCSLNF